MLGHPLPTVAWFVGDMMYADTYEQRFTQQLDSTDHERVLRLLMPYTVFGDTQSCSINQKVYLQ